MRRHYHRHSGSPLGLIFFLIILAAIGYVAWRMLPIFSSSTMGKFDRYNLVVGQDEANLVSVDLLAKSAVIVRLPSDLFMTEVAHGYGQYKIGSVFAAGQMDGRGGQTLTATVQEYLGVPIEGYVIAQSFFDPKGYFLSPNFLLNSNSNISILDKLKLALIWYGVRFDKINTFDLAKYDSTLVLADGSKASVLDKMEVDSVLNGVFAEDKIQTENLRVEVFNSTKTAGLGARAVRLLSNIGMSVINVDSVVDPITTCQIQADKEVLTSVTVARIADIYNCKISPKSDPGRAAVSVILGSDYAGWLSK